VTGLNQYQDVAEQSECKTCSTGPSTAVLCDVCTAGTYFHAQSRECVTCSAGTSQALPGQQSCTPCDYMSSSPVALQTGATECSSCIPGEYAVNTSHCKPCFPGWYGGIPNLCLPCPVDTFSNAIGATNDSVCSPCPIGTTTSNLWGATDMVAYMPDSPTCLVCPTGTFLNRTNGISSCTTCAKGSYASNDGSIDECELCPMGKFSDERGATECNICFAGTVAPTPGAVVCTPCPEGFSDDGQKMLECFECQAGEAAIAFECIPCGNEEWSLAGSMNCSQCPVMAPNNEKGLVVNNTCICPPGTTVDESNTDWCNPPYSTTIAGVEITTTPTVMEETTTSTSTTTTPYQNNTYPTLVIKLELKISLTEEEFASISTSMITIIAKTAQVDESKVTITYIELDVSNTRRRTLAISVIVGFEIRVDGQEEGAEANTETVQVVASRLSTSRISNAIAQDPDISKILPIGVTVNNIQIVPLQPDVSELPLLLMAVVSSSITILCICTCLVIVCCCKKKRVVQRNRGVHNNRDNHNYRVVNNAANVYTPRMRYDITETTKAPAYVTVYSTIPHNTQAGPGYSAMQKRKLLNYVM
jgi:hypothetical protein